MSDSDLSGGNRVRCFGDGDPLLASYHDTEWGTAVHDREQLFERLMLEAFQSGLSWRVILAKRTAFRRAFEGFRPESVAAFEAADVERLMDNPEIIRNRRKIEATINNAQALLALESGGTEFSEFLWGFEPGVPQVRPKSFEDVPSHTSESEAMASALKKAGFKFVGPVVCYAFMQSVGMVDDHLATCFVARARDGGGRD